MMKRAIANTIQVSLLSMILLSAPPILYYPPKQQSRLAAALIIPGIIQLESAAAVRLNGVVYPDSQADRTAYTGDYESNFRRTRALG